VPICIHVSQANLAAPSNPRRWPQIRATRRLIEAIATWTSRLRMETRDGRRDRQVIRIRGDRDIERRHERHLLVAVRSRTDRIELPLTSSWHVRDRPRASVLPAQKDQDRSGGADDEIEIAVVVDIGELGRARMELVERGE